MYPSDTTRPGRAGHAGRGPVEGHVAPGRVQIKCGCALIAHVYQLHVLIDCACLLTGSSGVVVGAAVFYNQDGDVAAHGAQDEDGA